MLLVFVTVTLEVNSLFFSDLRYYDQKSLTVIERMSYLHMNKTNIKIVIRETQSVVDKISVELIFKHIFYFMSNVKNGRKHGPICRIQTFLF